LPEVVLLNRRLWESADLSLVRPNTFVVLSASKFDGRMSGRNLVLWRDFWRDLIFGRSRSGNTSDPSA